MSTTGPDPEILDRIMAVSENARARGFTFPDGTADVNRYIEHLHAEGALTDPADPDNDELEDELHDDATEPDYEAMAEPEHDEAAAWGGEDR